MKLMVHSMNSFSITEHMMIAWKMCIFKEAADHYYFLLIFIFLIICNIRKNKKIKNKR